MCAPAVNHTQRNYGTATEKFAFECGKCFSGRTTNPHQQNPCIRTGSILITISYCTIYYLLYQEFLTVCAYPWSILKTQTSH